MYPEFWKYILFAAAFAVVLMTVIWWLALRINNLGIVDIAWSLAFAPLALANPRALTVCACGV